jgi:hypothetical protein
VNFRRFMGVPLSWTILVNLTHCPISGAHYTYNNTDIDDHDT